jgi:hypothetical protein
VGKNPAPEVLPKTIRPKIEMPFKRILKLDRLRLRGPNGARALAGTRSTYVTANNSKK